MKEKERKNRIWAIIEIQINEWQRDKVFREERGERERGCGVKRDN